MAIDFVAMEKEIRDEFEDFEDDEQEEILEGIEKLKAMSDKEIDEISDALNTYITEEAVEVEESTGGNASSYADDKIFELYLAMNPDEKKRWDDDGEIDQEAYGQFQNDHSEERKAALVEAIFGNDLMDDNVLDEIARDSTKKLAHDYELHPRIITYINPRGLLPFRR